MVIFMYRKDTTRYTAKMPRFVVLLPDVPRHASKTIDPTQYSNRVDWPVDGLDYQRQARSEWK